MRLGISLRSAYEPHDLRAGARGMVERARAADAAGLDSLFVGDHHGVPAPFAYYQNVPILGRLLAEWGDRTAGALFLLPLWHPVLVAEQVGTLASLASGPFVLQCAIGAGEQQFASLGTTLRERAHRMEASIGVVRALLRGDEVELEEPWSIGPTRISPVAPDRLEIWVGGHAEGAIDRAARLGDGWIAGPDATFDAAARLLETYRARCEAHGRTHSAVAIRRDVHVGRDDADAHTVADPVLEAGYRGFDPSACVVGGPETVAARLGELGAMGYTDVIVRHLTDDQGEALASIERLASVRAALRS